MSVSCSAERTQIRGHHTSVPATAKHRCASRPSIIFAIHIVDHHIASVAAAGTLQNAIRYRRIFFGTRALEFAVASTQIHWFRNVFPFFQCQLGQLSFLALKKFVHFGSLLVVLFPRLLLLLLSASLAFAVLTLVDGIENDVCLAILIVVRACTEQVGCVARKRIIITVVQIFGCVMTGIRLLLLLVVLLMVVAVMVVIMIMMVVMIVVMVLVVLRIHLNE
mmetsp:Transcript_57348/g.95300  ORF Transcript_57348/g.95300 Transcript_57348/m.95300 type:complete len:221 (-) Transcript_57348:317-979(-)